jgi:hypothetical protein
MSWATAKGSMLGSGGLVAVVTGLLMLFAPLNVPAFLDISKGTRMDPRSGYSPFCATKAEAPKLLSPKQFKNGATNSTVRDSVEI